MSPLLSAKKDFNFPFIRSNGTNYKHTVESVVSVIALARVKFGYTWKGTLEGGTFNVLNHLNYHLGYT